MSELVYAGRIPRQIDERVKRRDGAKLRPGALVRYQRIGLEKHPGSNYRFELDDDGSVRLARHSGDSSNWQTPFDTDLPAAPTAVLAAERVAAVRQALADAHFGDEPPYQVGRTAKGGKVEVVTARAGKKAHEVLYENARNPLLDLLAAVAYEVEEAG